jgi:hypothetical protein
MGHKQFPRQGCAHDAEGCHVEKIRGLQMLLATASIKNVNRWRRRGMIHGRRCTSRKPPKWFFRCR